MHGVIYCQKVLNLGPHRVVILSEYRLEHRKVVLRHLVHYLIEGIYEGVIVGVLGDVEEWHLESFCNHVVPIEDLLG